MWFQYLYIKEQKPSGHRLVKIRQNDEDKILALILANIELIEKITACSQEIVNREGNKTIVCRFKRRPIKLV